MNTLNDWHAVALTYLLTHLQHDSTYVGPSSVCLDGTDPLNSSLTRLEKKGPYVMFVDYSSDLTPLSPEHLTASSGVLVCTPVCAAES